MKKSFRTVGLLLSLALLISYSEARVEDYFCYEPYGEPVTPEFLADFSLVHFRWVVGERGMAVQASYLYDEETNTTICVVNVRMPNQVIGDPDMDSLGHEVLHCATGNFHPGEH